MRVKLLGLWTGQKVIRRFLLVFVICAGTVRSAVDAAVAGSHVGETTTVRGQVVQVSTIGAGMVFLNFGQPHPNSIFTVIARPPGLEGFGDFSRFAGKVVEVDGKIELHNGRPQIELRDPQSIRIAAGEKSDGKLPISNKALATPPPRAEPVGEMVEFKVELTSQEKNLAKKSPGGVEPVEATVGMMLPAGFDATKPQRVLVVFATDDGGGAHVQALPRFGRIANEAGWVAVAANGPALEQSLTPQWNAVMILAGLRALEEKFPGFKTWEFFTGGNSGGALRSSMMACALLAKGYAVKGVFMGSTNGERFSTGNAIFRPSRALVKKFAVFISHGTEDNIVSVQGADEAELVVKGIGIRNVKRDSYVGGHGMNEESFKKALAWFEESSKK